MGEFDLAEADFQRATELRLDDEERYVLLVNRGVMRIRRGRDRPATEDLQAAIALKPDQYQAYINLAQAYENTGPAGRGPGDPRPGDRADPEPAGALPVRAAGSTGCGRRTDEAALDDLDTGDPPVAGRTTRPGRRPPGAGLILQQADRIEEALAACDRALALRPDDPEVHALRGVASRWG